MKHLEIVKIGQNKGAPRIWIEGRKAAVGGFMPGTRYKAVPDPARSLLTLEVADDGMRIVSKKARGEKELPVIDLNSQELLAMFSGLEAVRVLVSDNKIHILPVASELRAKKRLQRLRDKVKNGQPLSIGSTSSGVGILDLAAHEGLALAGLDAKLAFANEIREDCMEHAAERNPAYTADTITLTVPMQELVFDSYAMSKLPETDVFLGGIPCAGASVAGRTKRKLEHPEDHPEVGHLVVAYLAMVAKFNPAVCVLENVVPYASSASMSIMRNQLRDLGYEVHETVLDADEWNMLEGRKRLAMVAVTKGMEFNLGDIKRPEPAQRTFGQIMDDVDPAHSTWGSIDYLWAKQERDAAEGKGFAPTVVDASSTKVPTLNKTLHKRQSTGTFIRHPERQNLYRIPTVAEHARCKGVPEYLVEGTTQTFGHETLGQAISMPPFVSAFEAIGRAIQKFGKAVDQVVQPVFALGSAVAVG
jgi:DNA (cytosine-5)-methyltransferase 1